MDTNKLILFINIFIDDNQIRSYSLSSHVSESNLEITIKFPEGSRARKFYNTLSEGDQVNIEIDQNTITVVNTVKKTLAAQISS